MQLTVTARSWYATRRAAARASGPDPGSVGTVAPMRRHRGLGTILSLAGSALAYLIAKVFGISEDNAFLLMVAAGFVGVCCWFAWIVVDALRGTHSAAKPAASEAAPAGWWAQQEVPQSDPRPTGEATARPAGPAQSDPAGKPPVRPPGW